MEILTKIIKGAMDLKDKDEIPRWPGITRQMSTLDGQAMLGLFIYRVKPCFFVTPS